MPRTIPSTVPAFSRSEERAILTVTCSAAFLFFNSFGSIGVALPTIQKQFGNSLSEIQWVTLMGVVTISSLSFCFGRAGEILGQRRLYKIGVALYAAGAGLGAISNSFRELLLARAVMAVGLAMALPMSTAILAASFDAKRRGQVLGLFASAIAVGRMTGSHHRRFASARGRLAVDFLDELHRRSGGDGGSDKNLSRPRRAPPRTLRFPRRLGLADRLSRTFAGSDLRRQSRLDIALCRGLVRGRGYRARQFCLARAAHDQAARRRRRSSGARCLRRRCSRSR